MRSGSLLAAVAQSRWRLKARRAAINTTAPIVAVTRLPSMPVAATIGAAVLIAALRAFNRQRL